MYSLVLMTAMATSPSTPEFHGYFRDRLLGNGCSGQTGGCYGMSASASCQGCSCHGGLFSGDRMRSFFSFGGGSCSGCTGCTGCSGAAFSCQGYAISYGCGSVAFTCGGGFIDMGTPYAQPVPTGLPGAFPTIPPTTLPMDGTTPYAQPVPAETREYTPNNQLPPPGSLAASPNRATVIVRLPAEAKLFAEGRELKLTSGERTFVSPELPAGREYSYTFRMEVEREGRIQGEQKTLTVRAGQVSTLEFDDAGRRPETIPAQMPENKPASTTSLTKSEPQAVPQGERARIIVKVPAGAALFVNDAKQTASDFQTPPLPAGKSFQYTMKIETTANGYPETATQTVTIRAGDSITVDFTHASAMR